MPWRAQCESASKVVQVDGLLEGTEPLAVKKSAALPPRSAESLRLSDWRLLGIARLCLASEAQPPPFFKIFWAGKAEPFRTGRAAKPLMRQWKSQADEA